MKIVSLTAENIKKLKAVHIEPDGNVVLVTGKNGAGKSSVLDSIVYALGGGKALPQKPIRKGASSARVVLDLDEIVVQRQFTAKGSYLDIRNKEGAKAKSPQAMLDKIVGKISFDPLEFVEEPDARKQRQVLLALLGVDLDEYTKQIEAIRCKRVLIGRDRDQCAAGVKSLGDVPDDCPAEEVSISELTEQVEKAIAHNNSLAKRQEVLLEKKELVQKTVEEVSACEYEITSLQEKIQAYTKCVKEEQVWIGKEAENLKGIPAIDTATIRDEINEADATNTNVRQKKACDQASAEWKKKKAEYDTLTRKIAAIEEEKVAVLTTAKMPIDGLSVTDVGVTYNDVPISQISQGEKLRVGVAVSMALNPKLKVLRITNGSLLDVDNLAAISQMVHDKDYQIWIEKVDDSGKMGLYIEDGELAEKETKDV